MNEFNLFWAAALIFSAFYCIAQAIRDIKAKNYIWAAAAAASAAALLLVPIKTHAIKVDLPVRNPN